MTATMLGPDQKDQMDEKQAFIAVPSGLSPKIGDSLSEASRCSSMDMETGCCKPSGTVRMGHAGRRTSCNYFTRNYVPWLLVLLAAFIGAGVISIELWRSREMGAMRQEIDMLKEDIDALRNRILEEDLLADFKDFEDQVYAEESNRRHNTVNDREDDDEDDDESEESGDYDDISFDSDELPDENDILETHRPTLHEKTSHDMLEHEQIQRGYHDGDYSDSLEGYLNVHELKQSNDEASRNKREVVSATAQGVPVIEEPYALRKNRTYGDETAYKLYEAMSAHASKEPRMVGRGWDPVQDANRNPSLHGKHHKKYIPSNLDYSTLERTDLPKPYTNQGSPQVAIRRSRVMQTDEDKSKAFRKVVKKIRPKQFHQESRYLEQVAAPEVSIPIRNNPQRRRRTHRPMRKNLETMGAPQGAGTRTRPLAAAHFNGDTSRFVVGQHEQYNGNGHLQHPDGVFTDWAAAPWVTALGMDRHFQLQDGGVTIRDTGIYFIYAQIYYLDSHDVNGFRVYQNNEPLLQCTTMTHTGDSLAKSNTCFTAQVSHLTAGDRISLRDLGGHRYSLFESTKSFFGVVKFGDARIK